jgi:hypothetical protein
MCSADAWSVIASPFLPKYLSSPRCAALNGALYLIGDNTKKVYVYDPGANLWQKVSHPRSPSVVPWWSFAGLLTPQRCNRTEVCGGVPERPTESQGKPSGSL